LIITRDVANSMTKAPTSVNMLNIHIALVENVLAREKRFIQHLVNFHTETMNKEDKKFYVYIYLDPRKKGAFKYGEFLFGYEPFYIGKGFGNRYLEHLMPSYLKRKSPKSSKIKKLIKLGHDLTYYIIKIKKNVSEQYAIDFEKELIHIIGRNDLKLGPLSNLTDGGEGFSGYKRTPEQIEKVRLKKIGTKMNEHTRNRLQEANTGRVCLEETKEKLRKINLGRKFTPEHREKLKKSRKGRVFTEETKNKMSISKIGKKQSQETVLKHSKARMKIKDSKIINKILDDYKNNVPVRRMARILGETQSAIITVLRHNGLIKKRVYNENK